MIRRGLFALFALTPALLAQGNPDWHRAFPAFKIAGNLYYVGTADLAVYLIHTPQGNILINSDFEQDVPMIRASIEKLGFRYNDTKIHLISHAHGDHDEGTGLIRKETDAKLMVMDADVPEEESTARGRPGAHVDRALHDGETVELGGSKLTARLTPGHTKGCTTWTMQVNDEIGRTFAACLRSFLRQDPDVILVGETRDLETAQIGIRAALTGHLVLSTLHTTNATETVNRIVDFFPPYQQKQVRLTLASSLRGVLSQRLLERADGKGRVPAVEALVVTGRVFDRIVEPQGQDSIEDVIGEGEYYGMQTFDQSLFGLYKNGLVTLRDAMATASHPHDLRIALQQAGLLAS